MIDNYTRRRLVDKEVRKFEDMQKGLCRSKEPQRGDFKMCREADKILSDYRRFKSKSDKKKIEDEYFLCQKEYRKTT